MGATSRSNIGWQKEMPTASGKNAAELVAAAPDVIFAVGTANVGQLLQVTRTLPLVFAYVADPVGAGFIESLARPGSNATGFIQFDYGLSAKWLELLKEHHRLQRGGFSATWRNF